MSNLETNDGLTDRLQKQIDDISKTPGTLSIYQEDMVRLLADARRRLIDYSWEQSQWCDEKEAMESEISRLEFVFNASEKLRKSQEKQLADLRQTLRERPEVK